MGRIERDDGKSIYDVNAFFANRSTINRVFDEIVETDGIDRRYYRICRGRLSHFHTRPNLINYFGLEFKSAYQLFCAERARILMGPDAFYRVLDANNRSEVIAASIAPYEQFKACAGDWGRIKFDIAFKANWLKYFQNDDLAEQLLRTGNKFLEFETRPPWGILGWNARSNNFTGKILMIIRHELRERENGRKGLITNQL